MRQKCSLSVGLIMGLLIFSSVSFAEVDEWTTRSDMPTARFGLSTSAVNGKIYAIGGATCDGPCVGFQTVEEYDPALDRWTKKADMPSWKAYLGTAVVNDKIYAIGGQAVASLFSSVVEEYDPEEDGWKKKENMIIGRNNLAVAVVRGRIYAIGGTTAMKANGNNIVNVSTSAVEEYNPVSDRWTQKADMPTARYGLVAAVVNNKIYCMGGNGALSTVEEYDPALDKWTKKANMPAARSYLTASAVNGKIYAIGGANHDGVLSIVEEYDPILDKWTKKADMPTARSYLSASSVNGKIYVIGGIIRGMNRNTLSTVEEYDTGFTGMSVDAKGKLAASWGEIKIKRP